MFIYRRGPTGKMFCYQTDGRITGRSAGGGGGGGEAYKRGGLYPGFPGFFTYQFVNIRFCVICVAGVGTMIGLKSGKVIGYDTRTKRRAVCEAASRKG